MNTLKIPYKLTNTTQISYKQHKSTFINIFPTQYSNMCKKRPFGCLVRNHDLLSRANVRCQQQQQHSVKCRSNQVKCYVKLQCKLQFKMQYKMQCEMQRRMKYVEISNQGVCWCTEVECPPLLSCPTPVCTLLAGDAHTAMHNAM